MCNCTSGNLEISRCAIAQVRASHARNDRNWEMETMTKLTDATRNKLKTVSTATVATALFKRGFRIQMIQDVHPLQCRSANAGRRGLHLALHAGARGFQQDRGVSRPLPSAAQGDRRLPARRGVGDGQPQGCPRGLGRRHPGDAADAARRRRRGHRRRFSRFRRNRKARLSRLPPPAERADQSDAAPGDRDQRADRLRRRAGVSRRRHPGRCRRRDRDPRASRRRDRQ